MNAFVKDLSIFRISDLIMVRNIIILSSPHHLNMRFERFMLEIMVAENMFDLNQSGVNVQRRKQRKNRDIHKDANCKTISPVRAHPRLHPSRSAATDTACTQTTA